MMKFVIAVVLFFTTHASYPVNGSPIHPEDQESDLCPESLLPGQQCWGPLDNCSTAWCHAIPLAECRSHQCDGCKARFYVNEIDVTESCYDCENLEDSCPICNYTYPFLPVTTCRPDRCDGCIPKFYITWIRPSIRFCEDFIPPLTP